MITKRSVITTTQNHQLSIRPQPPAIGIIPHPAWISGRTLPTIIASQLPASPTRAHNAPHPTSMTTKTISLISPAPRSITPITPQHVTRPRTFFSHTSSVEAPQFHPITRRDKSDILAISGGFPSEFVHQPNPGHQSRGDDNTVGHIRTKYAMAW